MRASSTIPGTRRPPTSSAACIFLPSGSGTCWRRTAPGPPSAASTATPWATPSAAQKRYTDLTEEVPAYQGGFIWDYIDQAITKRDRYGQAFLAYGGDFDDRPTDYEFCGDGLVYGDDRAPSPKMQEVKYLYQNLRVQVEAGRVRVANRYLFTDAAEFDCVVRLHRQGELVSEAPMEVRAAPGEDGGLPPAPVAGGAG